jgi:nicotinamidase-related amidase
VRALIVVDMQIGCFAGDPPRRDADGVIARINQLAAALRPCGLVVFIQHTDENEGFTRGAEAWRLLPQLRHEPGDVVIEKAACDSFLETPLAETLRARGVSEVVITGCATDFCVDTTVRAAASHGFDVSVASDAHTTRDRPHLDAATIITHHNWMWAELLLPRGRKVRVVPTAELLPQLANT